MWYMASDGRWYYVYVDRPNYVMHLVCAVLSLLTCGLFLPVWLLMAVTDSWWRRRNTNKDVSGG